MQQLDAEGMKAAIAAMNSLLAAQLFYTPKKLCEVAISAYLCSVAV